MEVNLLKDLLEIGLIDIGYDDSLFTKIEESVEDLANIFLQNPQHIIQATITSLDSKAPASEPVFVIAKNVISEKWPTFSNKFRDDPRTILRLVIFCALHRASIKNNQIKAIVWLTAVNQLEHIALGRENEIIRNVLNEIGEETEEWLAERFEDQELKINTPAPNFIFKFENTIAPKEATATFHAVAGPQTTAGAITDPTPNPHWPSSNQHWITEFGSRMPAAVSLVINDALKQFSKKFIDVLQSNLKDVLTGVNKTLREAELQRRTEKTQIYSLWWSQALYSSNLRKSYRELPDFIVPISMAIDLHEEASYPTPISTSYLLLETVRKVLSETSLKEISIEKILNEVSSHKVICSEIIEKPYYNEGRLGILDIITKAILENAKPAELLTTHSGIELNSKTTLDKFAVVLYRDLQARSLSEKLSKQVQQEVKEPKKAK